MRSPKIITLAEWVPAHGMTNSSKDSVSPSPEKLSRMVSPMEQVQDGSICITRNGEEGFSSFVVHLSQNDEFCRQITSLTLCGKSLLGNLRQPVPQLCSHILARILSRLPHLEVLTLQHVRFAHPRNTESSAERFLSSVAPKRRSRAVSNPGSDLCRTPFVPPMPFTVKKLSFHSVGSYLDTLEDLINILALFSEVGILETKLFSIVGLPGVGEIQEALNRFPSLRNLQVISVSCGSTSYPMLPILCNTPSVRSLHEVSATHSSSQELHGLQALLSESKQKIKSVRFDPFSSWGELLRVTRNPEGLKLNLSSCSCLEKLTLKINLYRITNHEIGFCAALPDAVRYILDSISSNAPVNSITFSVRVDSQQQANAFYEHMDWPHIDHLCDREGLKSVTFSFEISLPEKPILDIIEYPGMLLQGLMPGLHGGDMLRVECV